jgi:hypothetical protein
MKQQVLQTIQSGLALPEELGVVVANQTLLLERVHGVPQGA